MARIRSIHPDACKSATLANLDPRHERTFWRLLTHCDDAGRCEDRPVVIAATIYAANEDMTGAVLDRELEALAAAGLVARYEVNGSRFLQVASWGEYQHPQKPKPSDFPEPPDADHMTPVRLRDMYANDAVQVAPGEGEGEGEGVGGGEGVSTATPPLDATPHRLCALFADLLEQRGNRRPNVTAAWLADMDRLIRIDGREPADIERVLRWLDAGEDQVARFWKPNIRSPHKLRSKWDQMAEQYTTRKHGGADALAWLEQQLEEA